MMLLIFLFLLQSDVFFSSLLFFFFFFQAEDGIRDAQESRGLGDVYKRQYQRRVREIQPLLTMSSSPSIVMLAALLALALCVSAEEPEMVPREVQNIPGPGPRLHLVEKFATDAEMDHIITQAFPDQKPQDQETETGIVTELNVSGDPVLVGVFDRMRSILPTLAPKLEESHSLDTFRVRRYLADGVGLAGGDYHPPHTDWFVPTKGDLSHVLIVTMILYLTSPEEGGTTYFKHAIGGKGHHIQPVRGDVAVWWSCHRNGTQDWLSDHSSEPLKKGIKWNAARFFYADVKLCAENVEESIMVPKATEFNVAMKSSEDVLFGTSFPEGVSVTERGTSTTKDIHGSRRYDEEAEEDLDDEDVKIQAKLERDELIQEALAEMAAAGIHSEL
eukprot:TRINITY_DN37141_c0_g1_i1.p1 TRINITY_DN37141_c0_g1~~TRINITY_DN37141_c0_g1_i1.p1  ORF type:complete len:388 (-),score=111.00 TRINITY_DN37141_c0_g1_i1:425-1588(-)